MRYRQIATSLLILLPALAACLFWGHTINQPLIDQHAFRQTQTAITALFMQPGLDGFINYQTPSIGSPWAIPFELPLFQWLAHGLDRLLPLNLSACGRLLSAGFGIACLGPSLGLLDRYGTRAAGKVCFSFIYFSSAIYLYWNRSFMIESTALFFTLSSLYLYSLVRSPESSRPQPWRQPLLLTGFALSLSFSLLVKATTGLPILLLIIIDLIWQLIRVFRKEGNDPRATFMRLLPIATAALTALLLLKVWTSHADNLKALNPIGSKLTSAALNQWNYGSLAQRFSGDLWNDVLLQRMLTPLGAIPAALLLFTSLLHSRNPQQKGFIVACLCLAALPLVIFTNLHIVHSYYQSSNEIFLILALSASFDGFIQAFTPRWHKMAAIVAITLFALGNYQEFKSNYLASTQEQSSVRLEIGQLIQRRTPADSAILIFGDDWSSELAYHSQRRSLTRPDWPIPDVNQTTILQQPSRFLGGQKLGAVISKDAIANPGNLNQSCFPDKTLIFDKWTVYLCKS